MQDQTRCLPSQALLSKLTQPHPPLPQHRSQVNHGGGSSGQGPRTLFCSDPGPGHSRLTVRSAETEVGFPPQRLMYLGPGYLEREAGAETCCRLWWATRIPASGLRHSFPSPFLGITLSQRKPPGSRSHPKPRGSCIPRLVSWPQGGWLSRPGPLPLGGTALRATPAARLLAEGRPSV